MRRRGIIVDLDNTLCDNGHRTSLVDGSQKKDWDQFNALSAFDPHTEWCMELVRSFSFSGFKIVFLTARSDTKSTRKITEDWLMSHVGPGIDYALYMRPEKDGRPDYIVKRDVYNNDIAPLYDILFAVDDRGRVIEMWRSLGIPALHCTDDY